MVNQLWNAKINENEQEPDGNETGQSNRSMVYPRADTGSSRTNEITHAKKNSDQFWLGKKRTQSKQRRNDAAAALPDWQNLNLHANTLGHVTDV